MSELRVTFAGHTYGFEPGQVVKIGRSPDNTVVVPDPLVSREHAQIRWQADGWVLDDLGKGRTYVAGQPVQTVPVSQPLDVHLVTPLGPELRIESVRQAGPGERADTGQDRVITHIGGFDAIGDEVGDERSGVRHTSAIHRSSLWRGDISANHSSPVYQHIPAHHARLESPGGDFATAVHILLPVRSWLKDPGWKQGSRLLVIAYGLLPSLFVDRA